MVLSNVIKEQVKQYAVCNEDFNEIQQQINQIEDRYDDIAPGTQNIEWQHQTEGDQDLHSDFSGNCNLSDELGIPSVDNSEPLTMNELPDDEYRHIVQSLNKEQKEFFYHVLNLIKTSEEPFYCFLSGGAGVGKSHVTKALYQAGLKYFWFIYVYSVWYFQICSFFLAMIGAWMIAKCDIISEPDTIIIPVVVIIIGLIVGFVAWSGGPSTAIQVCFYILSCWGEAPVSWKSPKLFGSEKPFVKLRPPDSVKLVFSYVIKGIKIKTTSKFCTSRRLRFEDTKRTMSPEMLPKSFGTLEKRAPGHYS